MSIDLNTPPAYPLPDFDGVSTAFGASRGDYLTREQLGDWYGFRGTPYHKAAEGLFYSGGKLSDFGLTPKSDIDTGKLHRAVRALLSSWDPKQEIKIGTVAAGLANWCDYDAARAAK